MKNYTVIAQNKPYPPMPKNIVALSGRRRQIEFKYMLNRLYDLETEKIFLIASWRQLNQDYEKALCNPGGMTEKESDHYAQEFGIVNDQLEDNENQMNELQATIEEMVKDTETEYKASIRKAYKADYKLFLDESDNGQVNQFILRNIYTKEECHPINPRIMSDRMAAELNADLYNVRVAWYRDATPDESQRYILPGNFVAPQKNHFPGLGKIGMTVED
jgi:hypothetical protein